MDMDFTSAMETFAEAWVAANTQTAVTDQSLRHTPLEELPTMVNTEQLSSGQGQGYSQVAAMPPPGGSLVNRSRSHDQTVTRSHDPVLPRSHDPVLPRSHDSTVLQRSSSQSSSSPPTTRAAKAAKLAPSTSAATQAFTAQSVTTQVAPSPGSPSPLSPNGKSKPIHCVVEQASSTPGRPVSPPGGGAGRRGRDGGAPCESGAELDTYAILPSSTLFSEVVRVALVKLGYTAAEAIGAKGAIQIRHWKPLAFDTITENPDATVDDILGDLTSVATLRIKLGRAEESFEKEWTVTDIQSAVVELLREMNQSKLAKLSPLSQSLISNIANSRHISISAEKSKEFGNWYINFRKNQKATPPERAAAQFEGGALRDSRMTFHPVYELPTMRGWFNQNRNPTEEALGRYLSELNSGAVRKERGKISLSKLKIWWKNERQREKRIQNREMEKASQEEGRRVGIRDDSLSRSRGGRPREEAARTAGRMFVVAEGEDSISAGGPGGPDPGGSQPRRDEFCSNLRGSNDPLMGGAGALSPPLGRDLGSPSAYLNPPSSHLTSPSPHRHDFSGLQSLIHPGVSVGGTTMGGGGGPSTSIRVVGSEPESQPHRSDLLYRQDPLPPGGPLVLSPFRPGGGGIHSTPIELSLYRTGSGLLLDTPRGGAPGLEGTNAPGLEGSGVPGLEGTSAQFSGRRDTSPDRDQ